MAQATQGSVENLKEMRTGTLESSLSQADIAFWAHQGIGPYKGQPAFEQLTAIANLYTETVHVVVRAESDIRNIGDLRGKVVSVGEEGSGTLVVARVILEAAHELAQRNAAEFVSLASTNLQCARRALPQRGEDTSELLRE